MDVSRAVSLISHVSGTQFRRGELA